MKKRASSLFFLTFLIINALFCSPLWAVEFKLDGNLRVTDYLYDELDRYYGPPVKRANYFLQQTTINTAVLAGMTTGVVQLYINNLDQNNQPTGGYVWGSTGGYGSSIRLDPYIRQAYLEIPVPFGKLSGGRRSIKLGNGIILNDTSDQFFVNIPFSLMDTLYNVDLAYLKLSEPDSVNSGNLDDFDKNGYMINMNAKFSETDSFGFFYLEEKQTATGLLISDTHALALGLTGSVKAGGVDLKAEFDSITGHDGDFRVDLPRVGTNVYLSGSTELKYGRVGLDLLYIKGKRSSNEVSYNSFAGDFAGGHGILLNNQTRFGGGIDLNSGMVDMGDPTSVGYWRYLSHNFTSIKGFVELNPYKKLRVNLEIFPFVMVVDRGVLGLNSEKIGMEGNFTGAYPLDDHLRLSAGVAYFKAGDVLKEIAVKDNTPAFGQNILKTSLSLTWTF